MSNNWLSLSTTTVLRENGRLIFSHRFQKSPTIIPLFSLHYSPSFPTASMVASSETPSVAEQTASTVVLNIKPNQNLDLDLESSKYAEYLKPMIECLRYSPLAQALTMVESVLLIHLWKAFSTANYKHNEAMITFKVDSHKYVFLTLDFAGC